MYRRTPVFQPPWWATVLLQGFFFLSDRPVLQSSNPDRVENKAIIIFKTFKYAVVWAVITVDKTTAIPVLHLSLYTKPLYSRMISMSGPVIIVCTTSSQRRMPIHTMQNGAFSLLIWAGCWCASTLTLRPRAMSSICQTSAGTLWSGYNESKLFAIRYLFQVVLFISSSS